MKRIIVVLLLCTGFTCASAQEVYNSSGKPGYHKKTKNNKGYDPDKLIIGGSLNGGFYGDYANAGISPMVGYRFAPHFSAGVGLGYQFYKYPDYIDQFYQAHYAYENIVYPSIWARYFVYRNIFIDASFEFDFINLKEDALDNFGNPVKIKTNVTQPCLPIGVGLRQPLGGRVSAYAELIYDVIQGTYSPYPKHSPDIRIGFGVGF
jgi:hypothetical protein